MWWMCMKLKSKATPYRKRFWIQVMFRLDGKPEPLMELSLTNFIQT